MSDFLDSLLERKNYIDVRAPIEFENGHWPGAYNFPLLNDEERAVVGTIYKQQGQASAIEKGHQLISGDTKEKRLEAWINFIKKNPDTAIYCFRGGLRSRTVQKWLRDSGLEVPLIEGGYKKIRQSLLDLLHQPIDASRLALITGPTGSGKTHLIQELCLQGKSLDLEALANHRGSVFGPQPDPQPSQSQFENQLAVAWFHLLKKSETIFLEDESRTIGKLVLPEMFFHQMRKASVVWIEEPLSVRVENIFADYILATPLSTPQSSQPMSQNQEQALLVFDRYKKATLSLQKKLGGQKTSEILNDLEKSEQDYKLAADLDSNRVWIEKLLKFYYDPLYLGSLERRKPSVLFRGPLNEARAWAATHKP